PTPTLFPYTTLFRSNAYRKFNIRSLDRKGDETDPHPAASAITGHFGALQSGEPGIHISEADVSGLRALGSAEPRNDEAGLPAGGDDYAPTPILPRERGRESDAQQRTGGGLSSPQPAGAGGDDYAM